jgi:hypothetical protein
LPINVISFSLSYSHETTKHLSAFLKNLPAGKCSGIILPTQQTKVYLYGGVGGARPAQDTEIAAKSL